MRILYLHPRSWTGELPILLKLREQGHEVSALEEWRGMPGPPWKQVDHFALPNDGIRTLWYDPGRGWEKLLTWPLDRLFKRGFEGRNLIHRMWMILRAVRCIEPQVMVCSDGFTFTLPASFLRQLGLLKVPLVASYIGGDILDCPHAEIGRSRAGMTGCLLARSYRGIDLFRPVSPMLRDVLLGDGVAPARLHVCPSHLVASAETLQGVLARKTALRQDLRAKLGIDLAAPLIVTLSANIKGKGLHVLARAWPQVLKRIPAARWLLCGPRSEWLQTQVLPVLEAYGVGTSVCIVGALHGEAVFEHLAAADLHVNPSLCEGLNMVTVEAAAVGTPTITTSAAGIADWVERFGAGAVVPAGEESPLSDAIIRALLHPERLQAWSVAATTMSGEFGLDRVAGELIRILKQAAHSQTPSL